MIALTLILTHDSDSCASPLGVCRLSNDTCHMSSV
jgi:hypothetical protein